MTPPLVSVVIPTFNRMPWLPASLESVRRQTVPDLEIIVVDDGSTDRTAEWIASLDEARLRYIRLDHSGNIASVRNAGVGAAQTNWIAFLDSDDEWRPNKIALQLDRLRESPEAGWCYGAYQMVNGDGLPIPQRAGGPWQPFDGHFVDRLLTTEASVLIPTLVVRSTLARTIRFDERLPLAEDYDFILRLATISPGCVVDTVVATIRDHDARTTTRSGGFDGHLGKAMTYRKAARDLPDAAQRATARRQLRSHLRTLGRRAVRSGALADMARALARLRRI